MDGPGVSMGTAHPYTVNVRHGVESLTVSATRTDRNASVAYAVNGAVSNTGLISLAVGNDNVVLVTVTAEDRTTQKFYQVTVTRASSTASDDATLMTLSVTPAEGDTADPDAVALSDLDEKFAHMVDLTNAKDSVAIEIGTTAIGAVVTVKKGSKVITAATDGGNYDVDIDVGDNTITVDVLAPNFVATKTYTLTINRARRNASDNATLRSFGLSPGMLMPAFDPANLPDNDNVAANNDHPTEGPGVSMGNAYPYAVSVPHSVFEVTVTAATTDSRAKWEVTTPADDSGSPVDDSDSTRNGHQVDVTGTTTEINIMATAEDRTTEKFYQVTVTRAIVSASTDATLMTLSVTPSEGDAADAVAVALSDLDEKFAHMVDLTNAKDSVAIEIGTTATGAVVTVKKGSKVITAATDGGNYDVDIDEGDNTITVDVLAPNFVATKTYTLTINRASSNASDDDRLSSLSLRPGILMPAFDPANLPDNDNVAANNDHPTEGPGVSMGTAHPYAERVANSVESLTVRAQAAHSGAMVNITSGSDSSVSDGAVDLVVDDGVETTNEKCNHDSGDG